MSKGKQATLFQSWGAKKKETEPTPVIDTGTCSWAQKNKTTEHAPIIDITDDLDDDDALLAEAMERSMHEYHEGNEPTTSNHGDGPDVCNISIGVDGLTGSTQGLTQRNVPPGFDKVAGKLWIYPTNYPVRDYQYNIVGQALLKNTMVTLPTGLGKTFIAAVVMYNFYSWYPQGKVVFMAPTKPLVAQQIEACYNIMGIPQEDTAEMTGTMAPTERRKVWVEKRVFFLTPQVIMNDLSRGTCPAVDVRCLVIDEAHKATGNHAYCQVVRELAKYTTEFRILALSATPGGDIKAVQQVLANLMISHIELRTEESADIKQYSHERKVDKIVVPLGDELTCVKKKYIQIMDVTVNRLKRSGVLYRRDTTSLSKFLILKAREDFRQNPPQNIQRNSYGSIEGDFALAMSLYHGYELLQLHGSRSLYNFLDGILHGDKAYGRTRTELTRNPDFNDLMDTLREKFAPPECRPSQSNKKPIVTGHPKMEKLEQVVLDHFNTFNKGNGETRVMIFSQYRDSVTEITNILKQHHPVVKVMSFIGQSSAGKATKGFTQKEQLKVMKDFREGGYNTLVSTCVGEEGLDIGDVDLIVCFDAHKSPIRLVQRMGRTGRKREGRIVMLVTEGKEEQIYNQSQYSKKSVHKAILNSARTLHFYQDNPAMVPDNWIPQCHKMFITVSKKFKPSKSVNQSNQNKITSMFTSNENKGSGDGGITREEYEKLKQYTAGEPPPKKLPQGPGMLCLGENYQPATKDDLSLTDWFPWQNRLQHSFIVDHSRQTKNYVEMVEFLELQEALNPNEDNYGQEMEVFLNEGDVLKPGQNDEDCGNIKQFFAPNNIFEKQTKKKRSLLKVRRSDQLPEFEAFVLSGDSDDDLPAVFDKKVDKNNESATSKLNRSNTTSKDKSLHEKSKKGKVEKKTKPKKRNSSGNTSIVEVIEDTDVNDFIENVNNLSIINEESQEKAADSHVIDVENKETGVEHVENVSDSNCLPDLGDEIEAQTTNENETEPCEDFTKLLPSFFSVPSDVIVTEKLDSKKDTFAIPEAPSLDELDVLVEDINSMTSFPKIDLGKLVEDWKKENESIHERQIANRNNHKLRKSSSENEHLISNESTVMDVNQDTSKHLTENIAMETSFMYDFDESFQCSSTKGVNFQKPLISNAKNLCMDISSDFESPFRTSGKRSLDKTTIKQVSPKRSSKIIDQSIVKPSVNESGHTDLDEIQERSSVKDISIKNFNKSPPTSKKSLDKHHVKGHITLTSHKILNEFDFSMNDSVNNIERNDNHGCNVGSPLKNTQEKLTEDKNKDGSKIEVDVFSGSDEDFLDTQANFMLADDDLLGNLNSDDSSDNNKNIEKEPEKDNGESCRGDKSTENTNKEAIQRTEVINGSMDHSLFDDSFMSTSVMQAVKTPLVDEERGPSPTQFTFTQALACVHDSDSLDRDLNSQPTSNNNIVTRKREKDGSESLTSKNKTKDNDKAADTTIGNKDGNFTRIKDCKTSNIMDKSQVDLIDDVVNDMDNNEEFSDVEGEGDLPLFDLGFDMDEEIIPPSPCMSQSFSQKSVLKNLSQSVLSSRKSLSFMCDKSKLYEDRSKITEGTVLSPTMEDVEMENEEESKDDNGNNNFELTQEKTSDNLYDEDNSSKETDILEINGRTNQSIQNDDLHNINTDDFQDDFEMMPTSPVLSGRRPATQKINLSVNKEYKSPVNSKVKASEKTPISFADSPLDDSFVVRKKRRKALIIDSPNTSHNFEKDDFYDFKTPVRPVSAKNRPKILSSSSEEKSILKPKKSSKIVSFSIDECDDFDNDNWQNSKKKRNSDPVQKETEKSFDKKKRKSKSPANPFLVDEAEISEDEEVSSDEEEGSDLEHLEDSFVSEGCTQLSQGQHEELQALYLKSVRSPAGQAGQFKLQYDYDDNIDVYSQVPHEEESQYYEDSFVVDEVEENTLLDGHEITLLDKDNIIDNDSYVGPRTRWSRPTRKKKLSPVKEKRKRVKRITDSSSEDEDSKNGRMIVSPMEIDNKNHLSSNNGIVSKPSIKNRRKLMSSSDEEQNQNDKSLSPAIPCSLKTRIANKHKLIDSQTFKRILNVTESMNNTSVRNKTETQTKNKKEFKSPTDSMHQNKMFSEKNSTRNIPSQVGNDKISITEECNDDDDLLLHSVRHVDNKPVIIVDSREINGAQDIVSTLRFKHNLNVIAAQLDSCDYVVSIRMGIDRKQWSEFSNGSNRAKMTDRVQEMCDFYERPCLIIEKDRLKGDEKGRILHWTKYVDKTLVQLIQSKMTLFFTENQVETASMLAELCQLENRKNCAISCRVNLSNEQQNKLKFYRSIPHLSYVHCLFLCNNFTTVGQFLSSDVRTIMINGKMTEERSLEVCAYITRTFDTQMLPSNYG